MPSPLPKLADRALACLEQTTTQLEATPRSGSTSARKAQEVMAVRDLRSAHQELSRAAQMVFDPAAPATEREREALGLGQKLAQLGAVSERLAASAESYTLFTLANHGSAGASRLLDALREPLSLCERHAFVPKTPEDVARFTPQLPQHPHLPPLRLAVREQLSNISGHPEAAGTVLRVGPDTQYQLGPALSAHQGSYGEVFRAQRPYGSRSAKLLVKVQRSVHKIFAGETTPKASTIAQDLSKMLGRAATAQLSVGRIDAYIASRTSLFAHPEGALRALGFEQGSIALVDHFVDGFGKYYQVMHAMSGDLVDLSTATLSLKRELGLSQSLVNDLRLSVGVQTVLQLQAMHRRPSLLGLQSGLMHNDLKLSNMVFNHAGAVRLIDFDEVHALSRTGKAKERLKKVGTLSSPELELSALRRFANHLDDKHDIFNWGATMLDFAFGLGRNTLFQMGTINGRQEHVPGLSMAVFVAWHEQSIGRAKTIDWPLPLPDQKSAPTLGARVVELLHIAPERVTATLEQSVLQVADKYARDFNERGEHDPRLTGIVLARALQPKPGERASAKELSQELLRLSRNLSDAQRAEVLAHVQLISEQAELGD